MVNARADQPAASSPIRMRKGTPSDWAPGYGTHSRAILGPSRRGRCRASGQRCGGRTAPDRSASRRCGSPCLSGRRLRARSRDDWARREPRRTSRPAPAAVHCLTAVGDIQLPVRTRSVRLARGFRARASSISRVASSSPREVGSEMGAARCRPACGRRSRRGCASRPGSCCPCSPGGVSGERTPMPS